MPGRTSTFFLSCLLVFFAWNFSIGTSVSADSFPFSPPLGAEIQILPDREYEPVLRKQIEAATSEVLVSMYLFRTDNRWSNPSNRIYKALKKAAQRGVHITVLLEREDNPRSSLNENNRKTAKMLESQGMNVYFDSPAIRTHTKVFVIDRQHTFIGSHNLTRSALESNHELSVMITSQHFAEKVSRYIEEIISKSEIHTSSDSSKDLFR